MNSVDRLLYLGGESRSVTSLCRQMRSKATRDDRANGSVERIVVDDSGWALLEHWWDSGAFGDDPTCTGNRLLASVVHGVVHRDLLNCSLWQPDDLLCCRCRLSWIIGWRVPCLVFLSFPPVGDAYYRGEFAVLDE